jgi:Putative zinc-finger
MTRPEKLLCGGARRSLSDWIDGAPLPWWSRLQVRLHLKVCPMCQSVHRSLLATDDALRALQGAEPGEDAPPRKR